MTADDLLGADILEVGDTLRGHVPMEQHVQLRFPWAARRWTAPSAARSPSRSPLSVAVDTSGSCFVRPQVRRNGVLVATGNPTWLLRSAPPGGIPAARQA